MKNKISVKAGIFLFVVLITIGGLINYYFETKALRNGTVITAIVKNEYGVRGGLKIDIEYTYEGKKYDGDFLADYDDSIKVNDQIQLKISKDPVGRYIKFLGKIHK